MICGKSPAIGYPAGRACSQFSANVPMPNRYPDRARALPGETNNALKGPRMMFPLPGL